MRYSCWAVVGHGQKCEPNYQCDACAAKQKYIPRIEKLEAALRICKQEHGYGFPLETTRMIDAALEGSDD